MMKVAAHVSDDAYAALIQLAYQQGYVRGVGPLDKPRGLSMFVGVLAMCEWRDTRPSYLIGTGQWHRGTEWLKERCLQLAPATIADIGTLALNLGIFPYKTQAPVVNGFRREATVPVLYQIGATPLGKTSVKALVGPVLEAIGLGYLTLEGSLRHAPPDLYQGPSRREALRQRKKAATLVY